MPRPFAPLPLDEVERLAAAGLSEADIAGALGIHPDTLRRRKHTAAALVEAIARGRARGTARAADALARRIDDGDTRSILFYLRARAGWSEAGPRPFQVHPYGADTAREDLNLRLGRQLGAWLARLVGRGPAPKTRRGTRSSSRRRALTPPHRVAPPAQPRITPDTSRAPC